MKSHVFAISNQEKGGFLIVQLNFEADRGKYSQQKGLGERLRRRFGQAKKKQRKQDQDSFELPDVLFAKRKKDTDRAVFTAAVMIGFGSDKANRKQHAGQHGSKNSQKDICSQCCSFCISPDHDRKSPMDFIVISVLPFRRKKEQKKRALGALIFTV